MPTLYFFNQNSSVKTLSGFTLVEMVISITISALIIGASSYFILKTTSETQTSKNRTQIHIEISTFIEKMNYLRGKYSTGSLLIDNMEGYDTLLLTNAKLTSGVLIGVVNLGYLDVNAGAKLDSPSSFSIYNNKAIGIQELTSSQLSSLLAQPTNAYNITFQSNRYYPGLQTKQFAIRKYNSGSLFEVDIGIYERPLAFLRDEPIEALSNETILPFNLVF